MAISLNIITREGKGAPLTVQEIDGNFVTLKAGIEAASPPGFNFNYNAGLDLLSIDNTIYGSDLAGGVSLFPSLGTNTVTIGHEQGAVKAMGTMIVDRPMWDVGPYGNMDKIFVFQSGGEEVLSVRQDGVMIFAAKDVEPDEAYGGMYFDGYDFWLCGELSP